MNLLPPTIIEYSIQDINSLNTFKKNSSELIFKDKDDLFLKKSYSHSTMIEFNNNNYIDISTWSEYFTSNEYDVIIPLSFSKTVKMKSKIKKVSKYIPILVLD